MNRNMSLCGLLHHGGGLEWDLSLVTPAAIALCVVRSVRLPCPDVVHLVTPQFLKFTQLCLFLLRLFLCLLWSLIKTLIDESSPPDPPHQSHPASHVSGYQW